MALRTDKIDLEARVAVLSIPRQCVPHLLDLLGHIQVRFNNHPGSLLCTEYGQQLECTILGYSFLLLLTV